MNATDFNTSHLFVMRTKPSMNHPPVCRVCQARMFTGDHIGYLIGIHGAVCMSCWYYFQMP